MPGEFIGSERASLEKKAQYLLQKEKTHALIWLIPSLILAGFNIERAKGILAKRIAGTKNQWQETTQRLKTIEKESQYPITTSYVKQITELASKLPPHLKQRAYYPYAGTDIHWAAVFPEVILEDQGYDSVTDNPGRWEPPQSYKIESLESHLEELKQAGLVPPAHNITFMAGDSSITRADNDFNRLDYTLIFKSGGNFGGFIADKRGTLNFGSIIIFHNFINPRNVKRMTDLGYIETYQLEENISVPWITPFKGASVYIKDSFNRGIT